MNKRAGNPIDRSALDIAVVSKLSMRQQTRRSEQ